MSNFKLGTVKNIEGRKLQILLDGEEEPTQKKYVRIESYSPRINERVLIALVGENYVILGRIIV